MLKWRHKSTVLAIFWVSLVVISGLIIYQVNQAQFNNQKARNQKNQNSHKVVISPLKNEEHKKDEQSRLEVTWPTDQRNPSEEEIGESPSGLRKEQKPLPPKIEETVEAEKKLKEGSKKSPEEPKIPLPSSSNLPSKEERLKIVNGKVQVPKRWLWTTEMNDIVSSFIPHERWDEEVTHRGAFILGAGSFVFGSGLYDAKKDGKRDLNQYKTLKQNELFDKEPEICFIPVNVNSYHHSLLIYKKGDNLFRHYDSLGGSNFITVQNDTINGNLIQMSCPQQSGDGWGSCGTYPPTITSILLKRYKENGLTNPSDWEISKEEFLTERDQIMDLV